MWCMYVWMYGFSQSEFASVGVVADDVRGWVGCATENRGKILGRPIPMDGHHEGFHDYSYRPLGFYEGFRGYSYGLIVHYEGLLVYSNGHIGFYEGFHVYSCGPIGHYEGFLDGLIGFYEGFHGYSYGAIGLHEGFHSYSYGLISHHEGFHCFSSGPVGFFEGFHVIPVDLLATMRDHVFSLWSYWYLWRIPRLFLWAYWLIQIFVYSNDGLFLWWPVCGRSTFWFCVFFTCIMYVCM